MHIPFFVPKHEASNEEDATDEAMKDARAEASMSMGELIAVGYQFSTDRVSECIKIVSTAMPRMGFRTQRSYATVLAFALIVSLYYE